MEAGAGEAPNLAAVVEVGLFCTLRTKRCRRVASMSLSVPAAMLNIKALSAMVAPAALMAWWQMAGRVVPLLAGKVGQAALGMQVEEVQVQVEVEAAVALENQGRQ